MWVAEARFEKKKNGRNEAGGGRKRKKRGKMVLAKGTHKNRVSGV